MVFSSIAFIFFFLPLFFFGYFVLRKELKLPVILLASLFFYFWGENYQTWIIITSILINYAGALLISVFHKKQHAISRTGLLRRTFQAKLVFWITISANIGLLGYFKYFNFLVDSVNQLAEGLGTGSPVINDVAGIALPLGISFFTFQAMSYTIDVYRGHVPATRNLVRFAAYVSMFPQLVAGPIVRYIDIESQLGKIQITSDDVVIGIKRFVIGLAKKVLIANTMASVADKVFALPLNELTPGVAWIGVIAYTLQIYFDFSGYSCMAIGLGRIVGFRFLENFNYPYISKSIKEFWRRWHISLSTWFRDYLYIPLGGNKAGKSRTWFNLVFVFFICGLWHGASWNFVVWGMYHGVFLVLERMRFGNFLKNVHPAISHFYVLLVVVVGWVFFRAETLNGAIGYLSVMFGFGSSGTAILMSGELLQNNVIITFIAGIVLSTPIYLSTGRFFNAKYANLKTLRELVLFFAILALFALSTLSIASGTYNPFIYFRF